MDFKKILVIIFAVLFVSVIFKPIFLEVRAVNNSAALPLPDEFEFSRLDAQKLNQLPPGMTSATAIIGLAIKGLMMFMGAIMFILVVYAGFLWMTAQGNSEKIDQARNIIVWATLGVAVMMVSYVVVNFLFEQFKPAAPTTSTAAVNRCDGAADGKICNDGGNSGVPMICSAGNCVPSSDVVIPMTCEQKHPGGNSACYSNCLGGIFLKEDLDASCINQTEICCYK
jgi:hypothetical protein